MNTKNELKFKNRTVKLLNTILNHTIANRGTENQFFVCYTYPTGKTPKWVKDAENFLKELNGEKRPKN